ncbi:hypothetical protein AB3N59_13505 [Leptospira sp. WS92.C1]
MPYDYDFDEEFELETGDDENATDEDVVTFACEDCDHRWEEEAFEAEDYGPEGAICPMCGSATVIEF